MSRAEIPVFETVARQIPSPALVSMLMDGHSPSKATVVGSSDTDTACVAFAITIVELRAERSMKVSTATPAQRRSLYCPWRCPIVVCIDMRHVFRTVKCLLLLVLAVDNFRLRSKNPSYKKDVDFYSEERAKCV